MKRFSALVIGGFIVMGCGTPQPENLTATDVATETRTIEMTVLAEIRAEKVFDLWTSAAGTTQFFAPAANIGDEIGEPYVIIFNPASDPEGADHGTKGSVIRDLEQDKRIAFGWTFPPFGPEFNTKPFPTWVEITVEPFGDDPSKSIVHFAHHGFPTDPAWDKVYSVFRDGNWPLVLNRFLVFSRDSVSPSWNDPEGDQLGRVLLKERTIGASAAEVWKAWTTKEGLESFFCETATVDLRPGGRYEILFSGEAPAGERGSEGCQIVSFVPENRLTFTWNSPPSLPEVRTKRTNVIIELSPSEDGQSTNVRLLSIGWGTGDQWEASYKYFDAAWSTVLDWLEKSFDSGGKLRE